MSKLPIISGRDLIKYFEKKGFVQTRQKGSHVILRKIIDGKQLTLTIPLHKELDRGNT